MISLGFPNTYLVAAITVQQNCKVMVSTQQKAYGVLIQELAAQKNLDISLACQHMHCNSFSFHLIVAFGCCHRVENMTVNDQSVTKTLFIHTLAILLGTLVQ